MTENGKVLPFPHFARPRVTVELWQERHKPSLDDIRAVLAADGYQAVKWASEPNQAYLAHAHIYTEVLWLIEGELTVGLPAEGRLLQLSPGDRIVIPAGTLHASEAGPEGALYLVATK